MSNITLEGVLYFNNVALMMLKLILKFNNGSIQQLSITKDKINIFLEIHQLWLITGNLSGAYYFIHKADP